MPGPGRPGRAPVYDHFGDPVCETGSQPNNAKYACKHCGSSVASSKTATSNRIRHIQVGIITWNQ